MRIRSSLLLACVGLFAVAPVVHAFNYGFLHSSVLGKLTEADMALGMRVTKEALDSGQDREWNNPDTGARGTIRILGDVKVPEHELCRRARLDVTAGGRSAGGKYTLCKAPAGDWKFHSRPRR